MRVPVVINKWWDCDPALVAMVNDNTRPPNSPWPRMFHPARPRPELVAAHKEEPVAWAIFDARVKGRER
jgi:hypothetical protein